MTKDELKAELDALDVEYPKDAKLADLEALYAPFASKPEDAPKESEAKPEEEPDALAVKTVSVACPLLNLRDAPGGDVVGVARGSEEFEVIEDCGEWTRLRPLREVWARSEFLA